MKKYLLVSFIPLISISIFSQEKSYTQPPTLGIHFLFNDFVTADLIRSSSLSTVLKEHQFGKLKNMSQGLALSFGKGLTENFDFSSTIAGSFLSYPFPSQPASGSDYLLLEADASVRGKMFSDKHWFVPYLQAGVGVSKYQGYWGTFIPAGVGVQISFFGEAYLQINSQYRIAVTETTNYHFMHSIGLVGNILAR
jgi:hypothetical protein